MVFFPSEGGDGHFWLNYQVVSGLSPACSLSCLHDGSPVSRLPCVICFPCSLCSLMSHPSVCSHNLFPALSASSSGTWITILIHLAVQDKCCLCSDGELSCSYFPKSRSWPISCWKTFTADTSCVAELVMPDFLQLKVAFKYYFCFACWLYVLKMDKIEKERTHAGKAGWIHAECTSKSSVLKGYQKLRIP